MRSVERGEGSSAVMSCRVAPALRALLAASPARAGEAPRRARAPQRSLPAALRSQHVRRLARAARRESRSPLTEWYLALALCWLDVEPPLRRRLLLRTHQWIAERLLAPGARLSDTALDLEPGAALTRTLSALVPAEERRGWTDWIDRVVAELRRALLRPL